MGNVLLELGVRMEERVAFLLPDSPEWAYVFFGAMKIGAVAIPLNTLLATQGLRVSAERLPGPGAGRARLAAGAQIRPIRDRLRYLEHVIVGRGAAERPG